MYRITMLLKTNNFIKQFGLIIGISTMLLLGGCANIGGEDISLLPQSKILDKLEVPPGLSPLDDPQEFAIADSQEPITTSGLSEAQITTFSNIRLFEEYERFKQLDRGENLSAEEFQVALAEGRGIFKVREFSNEENKGRVLVVDSFYNVWPRVINALEELEIAILERDAERGVISVYGIEIQNPPTLAQRLKLKQYTGRIDELHLTNPNPDVTVIVPKTTEGHEVDYKSSSRFTKRMRYLLLSSYNVMPTGEVDTAVATVSKKKVRTADGQTLIILSEPYDSAWERVGRTLVVSNLSISNSNRSAGEYSISYAPVIIEKEAAWKFWIKNKEVKTIGDSVQFLVRLKRLSDGVSIEILSTEAENEELALDLLDVLYSRMVT